MSVLHIQITMENHTVEDVFIIAYQHFPTTLAVFQIITLEHAYSNVLAILTTTLITLLEGVSTIARGFRSLLLIILLEGVLTNVP